MKIKNVNVMIGIRNLLFVLIANIFNFVNKCMLNLGKVGGKVINGIFGDYGTSCGWQRL